MAAACSLPFFLIIPQQVSATTIQGRAIGSFCCVLDMQGNTDIGTINPTTGDITSSNGSTQFLIQNHDDSLPPDTSNTARINWGTGQAKSNYLTNYFEFDGNGSNAGSLPGSTTIDSLFQIGTFDYYNAQTRQDNVSSISFDLNMAVNNSDQSMIMPFPTLRFEFAIDNTNDNSDMEASKDTVRLAAAYMLGMDGSFSPLMGPMDFTFDGLDYRFMLNGFAIIDPATGLPMLDANGNYIFSDSTSAYENSLTEAAIFGSIQSLSTVPLPAAAWLFGAGLLSLGLAGRRKSST